MNVRFPEAYARNLPTQLAKASLQAIRREELHSLLIHLIPENNAHRLRRTAAEGAEAL